MTWQTAILYPFLASFLYSLGCQSKITSFLWKRYPGWLAAFMGCPECTGFWYGLGLGTLGVYAFDVPPISASLTGLFTPVIVAMWCAATVPLIAWGRTQAMWAMSAYETPAEEGEQPKGTE